MSPIGLLRKAKSFRHNCEKNNNNNGESYLNFRTNRRQSFSCDSKVDTTDSHRSNFLTTLHNWRRREKEKRTLSVADRRKSVSISDVCEIKSMRQVEQESDLNIFRSDGNLPNIDESPINTEAFKSDFRAKLENVLAKGPPPKVCILFYQYKYMDT